MATANLVPTPAEINLAFPADFEFLFVAARYKVAYGGRGSAKSWSFARALIQRAVDGPERILCCRELQNSISESVHRLLSDQIYEMGYGHLFEIQDKSIKRKPYASETGKLQGSEFFFYGIKNNTNKVKSAEGITIVWCEEAEKISESSWEILIPTIRTPGSEIWVSFNPDEESDPTYQRFVVNPPPGSVIREVNWHQNPWFPEVLRKEMEYLRRVDVEAYEHVWGGQCRRNASSQIFRGKYIIEDFIPPTAENATKENPVWDGPYFGADWGFANDPVAISKLWIDYNAKPIPRLYVEYAEGRTGIELDDIPTLFKRIPGVDGRIIRGDSSRPETINHVANKPYCSNLLCDFTFNNKAPEPKCPKCGSKSKNLRIEPAEKWSGSVEDGIAWLKTFQIVFHSRCTQHIQEARLYSYKVDRNTKDVLAEVVDKHNHWWDADRYACQPMIRNTTKLGVWSRL